MKTYDVITVGAGPSGLSAITALNDAGLKCAIVEVDKPGGECTYYGCVPTKTLLSVTERLRHLKDYHDLFSQKDQEWLKSLYPDFTKIIDYKRAVVDRFSASGSWKPYTDVGIDTYQGKGRFVSDYEIAVKGEKISGKTIIIATGAMVAVPAIPGVESIDYLTHKEALELSRKPASIAIIGAGAVGIEFAQFFTRLGVETTVIKRSEHILRREDPEMTDMIEQNLTSEGVRFYTNAEIQCVEQSKRIDHLSIRLRAHGRDHLVEAEKLLIATGMKANTADIGLKRAKVKADEHGNIIVNAHMQTSAVHIYATGDVVGKYLLTHVGEYGATIIVNNILHPEKLQSFDERVLPWAVFCDPPFARVGLTEAAARTLYADDLIIARLDFAEIERARMMRQEKGRLKFLIKKSDRTIVGAAIVGPSADTIIHEVVLAMKANIPIDEIYNTVHIYPTLSEAIKWTAGKVINFKP